MKTRTKLWLAPVALVALIVITACGGSDATPTKTPGANPATTRRATAKPPATVSAGQPTSDQLDDSANAPAETPGADQLDDSSNATPPAAKKPPLQGGKVVLPATVWKVASNTAQTYLFCKNGKLEMRAGDQPDLTTGTFEVKGDQLSIKSGSKTTTYQLKWKDAENLLELNDGTSPLNLQYIRPAQCE
jgi:hypothetical protein